MSMPSLSKHGEALTKQPKQISPWQATFNSWLFVYISVFAWAIISRLYRLTFVFLGKKTEWFGANPVPTLPSSVSLIRVTRDSWVKPTLLRGIAPQFYHSFPFNAVEQQMAALLIVHQTPPRTCMGLLEQEGNVMGQIKSGVGCLLHGWLPHSAP